MRLVMVRHGESDGNAGNAYDGAEPHLTERGRRQARYAAERAMQRPYQALYTSPMSRALETACALAETTGLEPIVSVDLAEFRELPDFRGFARSILESRYPKVRLPDECTEDGWWAGVQEHEEALYERAAHAAAWLRERHAKTEDRVLLVTHGGFGSALLSTFLGLPPCGFMRFWQANCGYTVVDIEPGGVRLFKLSCTWHIPPEDWT